MKAVFLIYGQAFFPGNPETGPGNPDTIPEDTGASRTRKFVPVAIK